MSDADVHNRKIRELQRDLQAMQQQIQVLNKGTKNRPSNTKRTKSYESDEEKIPIMTYEQKQELTERFADLTPEKHERVASIILEEKPSLKTVGVVL
jgi:hypothetical protein